MKETKNTYSIEEARRYVSNAEEVIKKANYDFELKSYTDSKYIRAAGDYLWKGCLIALESVFHMRTGKGRPSIDKYKNAVAKRDKKLLNAVNIGYDTMHLVMGYDGNRSKRICDTGFELANDIIDLCEKLLPKVVCA